MYIYCIESSLLLLQKLDIIVFPEEGISSNARVYEDILQVAVPLPEPEELKSLCDDEHIPLGRMELVLMIYLLLL